MITKSIVLKQAIESCLEDLYNYVQPSVTWKDFLEQNNVYGNKYKHWMYYRKLINKDNLTEKEQQELSIYPTDWKDKSKKDCIGPAPFEMYFIPDKILHEIVNSYINAYDINHQQSLLDTIEILKEYCKDPIENGNKKENGFVKYEHKDSLQTEIINILSQYRGIHNETLDSDIAKEIITKFFNFLDRAGQFYNWTADLNTFNMQIYLGASPNSNKEAVIENWKKYKNIEITIDEEQMINNFYEDGDSVE